MYQETVQAGMWIRAWTTEDDFKETFVDFFMMILWVPSVFLDQELKFVLWKNAKAFPVYVQHLHVALLIH